MDSNKIRFIKIIDKEVSLSNTNIVEQVTSLVSLDDIVDRGSFLEDEELKQFKKDLNELLCLCYSLGFFAAKERSITAVTQSEDTGTRI